MLLWILCGLFIIVVVMLTVMWWSMPKMYETPGSPPGQFPMDDAGENQVEWPATERVSGYRPPPSWINDQDVYEGGWNLDAKRKCGLRLN